MRPCSIRACTFAGPSPPHLCHVSTGYFVACRRSISSRMFTKNKTLRICGQAAPSVDTMLRCGSAHQCHCQRCQIAFASCAEPGLLCIKPHSHLLPTRAVVQTASVLSRRQTTKSAFTRCIRELISLKSASLLVQFGDAMSASHSSCACAAKAPHRALHT